MDLSWMAWTWPTATFFIAIAVALITMTVWQIVAPGIERTGFTGLKTTRGDRLFVSLLGTAFIQLAWIGMLGDYYVAAAVVCVLFAAAMFRWF